jgi:aryl-alcohol dehydrogenase-like predicted oxidoreductase
MRYISLSDAMGSTLEISKIVLGGAPLGTTINREKSFEIMDYFISQGGNTIDTARVYCDWLPNGHGVSEKTIGEWVKARNNREKINIITKGGHPRFNSMHESRLSEMEIREDIERSLNTLQMDYVDLYMLHRDDENLPVEDIVDILDDLVKEGKIHAIGASNWNVERIIEANDYAKRNNKTPFIVSEIQWSLAQCSPKMFQDDTMICMDEAQYNRYLEIGMPVIAYSSQAGGVFFSGYKADLSDALDKHKKYVTPTNCIRYRKLLQFCEKRNCKPSTVALGYIMYNQLPATAIIGCSSLEQLKDSMSALRLDKEYIDCNRKFYTF